MVGGIDVAGVVHASNDPRYSEGDPVVITGFGLSEDFDGGYSEYVRASGDWLIPLPSAMSLRDSMAIGTAGFTAALAVDAMELNGQRPDAGPVLVNGATGGVGSFAIDMLGGLGYEVTAFTGKRDQDEYLRGLGASRILYRDEVEMGTRPLEKSLWAGAVDNVGGDQLGVADTHHAAGGQHRVHRARGRIQARDHRDAVHPAGGEPSRHQQRLRRAGPARTGVAASRIGLEAALPRSDRDVGGRALRPAPPRSTATRRARSQGVRWCASPAELQPVALARLPTALAFASSKWRIARSNLSRQPVLQNPTTWPSYSVSESACTGLPDQGQASLMQSAMSKAGIVPPVDS